jgi:signal recognition particle receptor subunit beta
MADPTGPTVGDPMGPMEPMVSDCAGPTVGVKEIKDEPREPREPRVDYEEMKEFVGGLDPNTYGLVVGVVVGILTLLLIWWWTSRKSLGRDLIICGACDSGKTTLLGQLVAGKPVGTCTSMVENRKSWCEEGVPSMDLVDVPGHERIRGAVMERCGPGARGILFVVDSCTVIKHVRDVAEFLHSILTLPSVAANSPPLLVFCNKQDLDLAKSSQLIKTALEKELDKVRVSRSNQLAGLEGTNNSVVFIGKEGKPFTFSDLRARVEFCEGSSQDEESLGPVVQWLRSVA